MSIVGRALGRLAGIVAPLLLLAAAAAAGEGVPEWCEVEADLGKNGRTSVTYTVRYRVTSGEFHGFYFSGPQIDSLRPAWDDGWGKATAEDGRTFNIERRVRNGKKTIELAGGAGLDKGTVIFRFRFAADMAAAGHLARTTDAEKRELAVFHWVPSTWDGPLQHYTVKVRYPVPVEGEPGSKEFLESVRFRTEPFMNKEYLIDYRRTEDGRFEVLLHREKVPKDYAFRIQQYVRGDLFDAAGGTAAAQRTDPPGR